MDNRLRLNITPCREEQRMLIRAQVWAPEWVSGPADPADDDQPVRRDWFTADEWSVADTPDHWRADSLRALCGDRGWDVLGDGIEDADGNVTAPLTALDWRRVLRTAAERRDSVRRAWERAETAWMGIVAGVPRSLHDAGYVSAIEIAEIGGIGRHRVYQIEDEVDHPEKKRRKQAARRRRA